LQNHKTGNEKKHHYITPERAGNKSKTYEIFPRTAGAIPIKYGEST
jgi:hypothetical protein